MNNSIVKTVVYTIISILLLVVLVISNKWLNDLKKERCDNIGGVFVLNTSDGNMSSCILK